MTTKNENFFTRLESFRVNEGLTQGQMAEKLSLKRDAYAKFSPNPTLSRINLILDTFPNLSAEWLMRGTGSMYKDDALRTPINVGNEKSVSISGDNSGNGFQFNIPDTSALDKATNELLLHRLEDEVTFLRNELTSYRNIFLNQLQPK